jgi:hypothetical protein
LTLFAFYTHKERVEDLIPACNERRCNAKDQRQKQWNFFSPLPVLVVRERKRGIRQRIIAISGRR